MLETVILVPGMAEHASAVRELRAEPLATRWWNDAESRAEPGVSYAMVFDDGVPAAWAGWIIERSAADTPLLRCCDNYVRRGHRGQDPDLYELAYRLRHRSVVLPSRLRAVTYLFPEPIALHEADGWVRDTGPGGSGVSPVNPAHRWQRLTWTPTA